jgi:hypothetical protein
MMAYCMLFETGWMIPGVQLKYAGLLQESDEFVEQQYLLVTHDGWMEQISACDPGRGDRWCR